MSGLPILSFLVFFPLAGAVLVALLPRESQRAIRGWATAISVVEFLASLALWSGFVASESGWQFEERRSWLPGLGASYHLGMDGISLLLVLLTTLLTAVSVISSYRAVGHKTREYYALLLVLETGMLGTFVALDLLLFYIFWEGMLVPMYFLIGVWGGPRRIYAAIKFFLYTMAGSVLMLVAILWLYFLHRQVAGFASFDLESFYRLGIPPGVQLWLFLAFGLAFAIKVPMFPFHTWLPDAHVEAPTAGSVLLAAILLKMGTYGFIRFALPLFPNAAVWLTPWIVGLALVGIVYGALVAMVQPDLKKLVAYSSVSHLGFVMLGMVALNAQGLAGSMLQMLNHGISTGALFLLVGVIYERRHTRLIVDFGGLWKPLPVYAAVFLVVMLSSVGLPGTNGFVGEFLVLLGAFRAPWPWARIAAAVAGTGVILSALYMLWMFQRVMFGPVTHAENEKLVDLSPRERLMFAPLLLLIFWLGIHPQPFLDRMEPSLARTVALMQMRGVNLQASGRSLPPSAGAGGLARAGSTKGNAP